MTTPVPVRNPVAAFAIALLIAVTGALAEDWPAWRGPTGAGLSSDRNLPLEWSDKKNLRWRVPLPDRGNSTPIVSGDRVFVTQAIESEHRRTLMCFARADGKLLWQSGTVYSEREPTNAQNPYCASSPATDGRRIIAYFGSAGLFCYGLDGKELWHLDVGKVDSWQGSGSSPVIDHDLCFLNAGPGTASALLACDVATGQVRWKALPPKQEADDPPDKSVPDGPPADEAPIAATTRASAFDRAMMAADPSGAGGYLGSWSTPVILHASGHDELVVVHALRVIAYEPKTGKVIWLCRGMPPQAFASPVIGNDILVAAGHLMTGGTRLTAVKLGGSGDITASGRLWTIDLRKECVGSGVIYEDHFYAATQFGTALCIDLKSGKRLWEKRLQGRGNLSGSWSSLVLADGRLLLPNQSGEVFVLNASPRFDLLADNELPEEESTCSSLAVSGGGVFLRTYRSLWCFGR